MDSKGRKIGVLIALSSIMLAPAAVMLVNYNQLVGNKSSKKSDETVSADNDFQYEVETDGKIKGADLSAFLKDEKFFDKDNSNSSNSDDSVYEEVDENGELITNLVVLASSVERDIRVKIVDDKGNAVAGHDFMVEIADTGAYIDDNKDGVIHIRDLKPGEYKVLLHERAGFKVPTEPATVRVKSIVSYTTIEDIEYFVHSESEIDALAEDTENKVEAVFEEDEDETQYKSLLDVENQEKPVELGIDVSKWNKEIDWEIVKAEGVDFAIIRCGYRGSSTGCLVEDPYFYKNIKEAKKAGIKVGVYFFTQATNLVEAVEEASMVITLLDGIELDYPVYIDTEGAGGNGRADSLDAETRTAVVNAFCQTIQNADLEAGVYASRNWYLNNLITENLRDVNIWLAEYRQTPEYTGKYDMWQYTSSGSVAGIEGRVDLNVSYK